MSGFPHQKACLLHIRVSHVRASPEATTIRHAGPDLTASAESILRGGIERPVVIDNDVGFFMCLADQRAPEGSRDAHQLLSRAGEAKSDSDKGFGEEAQGTMLVTARVGVSHRLRTTSKIKRPDPPRE